jgi:outer membrane biosynthesis protein TonB
MNPALRFTIITSLLLHALLYWGFNADLSVLFQPPEPQQEYSLEFELTPQPQPKVEAPKADLPPPPKHLQDDINKANTSDGLAESGSKQAVKKSPKKVAQQPKKLVESQSYNPDLLSNYLKQKKQIEEAKSQDDGLANMQEMDDSALDDSLIKSPKEQLEEEKARWFNDVLRRITEQIGFVWVKPQGIPENTWGVIRMDINPKGYLIEAWVHLPSGNFRLDQSALRAIRGVQRFEIPHADKLNRYYRHLEFRYHG